MNYKYDILLQELHSYIRILEKQNSENIKIINDIENNFNKLILHQQLYIKTVEKKNLLDKIIQELKEIEEENI